MSNALLCDYTFDLLIILLVCPNPPMEPVGGYSDPPELTQTFLAGDIISYFCTSELFAIEDGPSETTCDNTGIFSNQIIGTCNQVCTYHYH